MCEYLITILIIYFSLLRTLNTEITPKEWVIQLFWRRLLLTWNRSKNAVNKSNYREVNHVFISVIKERFRFTFTPWPVCLLLLFIITRQRSKDSNQFYPFLWAVFICSFPISISVNFSTVILRLPFAASLWWQAV